MLLGCGCLRWSSAKAIKVIMTLTIVMRLLQFHIGQTVNNNEWSCTPGALARPLPLAGQHLAQGTHRDCWNSSSSCPCPPYYLVQDYPITLLLLLRLTPPACQDKWHHPLIHPSSAKHQTTQAPLNIVQYLKTSVIRAYYSCYHPNMEVNKFCRFFSPWVVYGNR